MEGRLSPSMRSLAFLGLSYHAGDDNYYQSGIIMGDRYDVCGCAGWLLVGEASRVQQ